MRTGKDTAFGTTDVLGEAGYNGIGIATARGVIRLWERKLVRASRRLLFRAEQIKQRVSG